MSKERLKDLIFTAQCAIDEYNEYEDRLSDTIELPKGSIKKLIGRELSWDDEPVELKEE